MPEPRRLRRPPSCGAGRGGALAFPQPPVPAQGRLPLPSPARMPEPRRLRPPPSCGRGGGGGSSAFPLAGRRLLRRRAPLPGPAPLGRFPPRHPWRRLRPDLPLHRLARLPPGGRAAPRRGCRSLGGFDLSLLAGAGAAAGLRLFLWLGSGCFGGGLRFRFQRDQAAFSLGSHGGGFGRTFGCIGRRAFLPVAASASASPAAAAAGSFFGMAVAGIGGRRLGL